MTFYAKLFTKIIQKDRPSVSGAIFFLLRWSVTLFLTYRFPAYSGIVLTLYRLLMSNLMLTDNSLYFNMDDVYLFDFRGKKLFNIFLVQKFFLNSAIYRFLYDSGIVLIFLYQKDYYILGMLTVTEVIFLYLDYCLFKISNLVKDSHRAIKLLGEVGLLSIALVCLVVSERFRTSVTDHLLQSSLMFLVICIVHIKAFEAGVKKTRQAGDYSLLSFLHRKISIFTYKELRLFGSYFLSSSVILLLSIMFFNIGSYKLSIYLALFMIISSPIFFIKKKGKVINFEHDDYFFNKSLFSKRDYLLLVRQKFLSYMKISLAIKISLLMFVLFSNLGEFSFLDVVNAIVVMLVFIVNEFNALYVEGRINSLLQFFLRYLLLALLGVYLYLGKQVLFVLVLLVFSLKELRGLWCILKKCGYAKGGQYEENTI